MKISVIGLGYVGLSNAILLAQHNEVAAADIVARKVEQVNRRESPIDDPEVRDFLARRELDLRATTDIAAAVDGAEFVIVATPTDYDPRSNRFNTETVESVVEQVTRLNPAATIVIKSTVPVGFTAELARRGYGNVIFSPEFLREGHALYDNLYPSRVVVGERSERARRFAGLMTEGAVREDVPVIFTEPTEAEAVKLFSNTYLAMRVAFFNELDSYAYSTGLDAGRIIAAVGLDPRIGSHYHNPSFGYGGYCLPKDTRQLVANYHGIPQTLIGAIVESNRTRKDAIASWIAQRRPELVGVYRLAMKKGSDNFRSSAVLGIIRRLTERGVRIIIYEPTVSAPEFGGHPVVNDLAAFKARADLIVANRLDPDLDDVADKVFSRDAFGDN